VLRLTLAKREEAKPRRIEIKAGSGNAQTKTIDTTTKSGEQSKEAKALLYLATENTEFTENFDFFSEFSVNSVANFFKKIKIR
jgi:hypothetical protein